MKIKKPMTVKSSDGASAAPGGAAIADRLRLDPIDTTVKKGGTTSVKAAACALVFGSIALVAAGVLAYVLWQHWDALREACGV